MPDIHTEYNEETRPPSNVTPMTEGSRITVMVNAYERNRRARALCIKKYGLNCSVCSFNFSLSYGKIGENYIQVHHLEQLSLSSGQHVIEPDRDLRPVCANCHQMLHKKIPPYSIQEQKNTIKKKNILICLMNNYSIIFSTQQHFVKFLPPTFRVAMH